MTHAALAGLSLATLLVLRPVAAPPQAAAQTSRVDALAARLSSLPSATHNSRIRSDGVPGTALVRVWIDANEDDTRLYSPAGAQLDADFQISCVVGPGRLPDVVSLLIETRGGVEPGQGPRALIVRAGPRPVALTQRDHPPVRSGPLLFLSLQAEVSFEEFLMLVTADVVEGRVWDVPFRLLGSQSELLRAWAVQVIDIGRRG